MNRRALRSTAAWLILIMVGCSGGGSSCGGCGGSGGCTQNIPGGFPAAKRTSNSISAELSGQGLKYFQDNLTSLIGTVLGSTNGLSVNVPCTQQRQTIDVFGDVNIYACCSQACNIMAAINDVTITPSTAPDRSVDVNIVLKLNVNTGAIPIEVPVEVFGLGLCTIGCNMRYAKQDIPIDVTLNLKVDADWGDILAVNLMGLDLGTLIDPDELKISSQGGICSGVACGALSLGFVKDLLFQFLKPQLDSVLADAVDGFRCQKCDTARWSPSGCPTSTRVTNPPVATCQNDLCFVGSPSNHKCAPAELGMQGRVNAGTLLADFGGPADALMDIYAMAGGRSTNSRPTTYVSSGGGIVVGVMGGTDSPTTAACVPPHTAPALVNPDAIDFKAAASQTGLPPVTNYAAGIAISAPFINKALYDAYNAGVLCLKVDSSLTSFLSSGLFQGTLLPSLGVLTHGENVPMGVALRPKNPPTVLIGKGTTKMVNGMSVPDDPLLTLQMKELQLDFYGLIEEREVRLFSLITDVSLPLSLNFDPVAGTVTPALGDISALLSNTKAANSEMLAEDPAALAGLVESIIGLVQPLIGGILSPIALPTFQGLTIGVESARGAVANRNGVGYQHLALFASLALAGHPDSARTETTATLVEGVVPNFANIVGADRQLPYAVIDARADGARSLNFAGYEFAYRVDNGLWSPWVRNSRFEVHSPVFLLQGRHTIELISREIDTPSTQDETPDRVEFVVDYEAPQVRFDVVDGNLVTVASDSVWKDDLQYRYALDGGAWTSPGPAQSFPVAELRPNGSVEVEVIDGSGLSTKAMYGVRLPEITSVPQRPGASGSGGGNAQGGCSQGGLPAAMGLLLAALFLTRRRHA